MIKINKRQDFSELRLKKSLKKEFHLDINHYVFVGHIFILFSIIRNIRKYEKFISNENYSDKSSFSVGITSKIFSSSLITPLSFKICSSSLYTISLELVSFSIFSVCFFCFSTIL